ncbi:hypothetical protein G6011_09004 [Alternaria panax]|uniref:Uncharacterized protein n=1 Tax=Alternaria panax TaxID=48097 RepID=A0AAD4IA94_9PLEO|nr:hypothetical protein G6011_09004 [Alternaria panax]
MSSPNTITMVVPAPRLSVFLPNEVLRMVFKLMLVFSSVSPPDRPVNATRFGMLFKCSMLAKFAVVSRQFHEVALAVFYEHNFFDFAANNNYRTSFGVVKAPPLPPLHLHSSLRNVRLLLHLTDSWGEAVQLSDRVRWKDHPFTNTIELFRFCPAARVLELLSTTMTELRVLDLHIAVDFRLSDRRAAIAIYRSAGFLVRAREVKLTIVNGIDGCSETWHALLKNVIV